MVWKIVLLFWLFLNPASILAHSSVQVIEMTAEGFKPSTVTVDQNQTIIFINRDTVDHWPASNVHPTHELYPEFDPKRPVKPNESWSFKPQKAGNWKFHDHLLPHERGEMIVLKEGGQVVDTNSKLGLNILDQVKKFLGDFWEKFNHALSPKLKSGKPLPAFSDFNGLSPNDQLTKLKEIAKQSGAGKAWQFIKDGFKGQSGSMGNIHDLAHLTGGLIFQEKGFPGLAQCSSDFAFGCYHGFLDKAFEKNLDHLLDAQNSCLKLGPENSGPVASCIHGIGHGVASFFQTADLKKSLSSCRKLTSGQQFCFDGVFMEYVRNGPEATFKKDDPYFPCNSLEKEFGTIFSFACGRNQPTLLLSRFQFSFDDVVPVCLNWSSEPSRTACIDALGFTLARQPDEGVILDNCKKLERSDFILRCAKSAAGELVFQEIPGWYEKSRNICHGLGDGSAECLDYVDRIIKEYGRRVKPQFRSFKKSEDLNEYLRGQIKLCYEIAGRDSCYKDVASLLYGQFGLSKTLQLLKDNEDYTEVYARCHEVTHYLSRLEYDKQQNIAKVYAQCDSTCHGGCYHGTLEAFLKQKTAESGFDLNRDFPKICGKQSDYQKPIEFNECLHGLGHAAMFIFDMELKKSLGLCDSLGDPVHIERCHTGAFMENSSSSTSDDHASIYIKTDDPFYPCNALEEKYQAVCWQYQSSYFSIITHQDWRKIADMCLQIPAGYQDNCFKTIGTNQVGFTKSLQKMKDDCDLMPDEHFRDVCVLGVVSSLSYRFVGDAKKIIDFCAVVDPGNKETCFKQMGTGILDWNANKDLAKKECGKIPDPQGSTWCLSVI